LEGLINENVGQNISIETADLDFIESTLKKHSETQNIQMILDELTSYFTKEELTVLVVDFYTKLRVGFKNERQNERKNERHNESQNERKNERQNQLKSEYEVLEAEKKLLDAREKKVTSTEEILKYLVIVTVVVFFGSFIAGIVACYQIFFL